MPTITKIDEVRDEKRFVLLEHSVRSVKSVLATKMPVEHSFFIDGAPVNEKTFRAFYEASDTRVSRLLNRAASLMEAFKATFDVDLEALDQIEGELTSDERKIFDALLTNHNSELPEGELKEFLTRTIALAATFEQCMTGRLAALQGARTNN